MRKIIYNNYNLIHRKITIRNSLVEIHHILDNHTHNNDNGVQYNKDKIQIAIDIIDNLIPKLEELEMDDEDNFISKDSLDDINREYQLFASQKLAVINFLKDNNKKVIAQIEDMKFSTLNNYLSSKYAFVKKDGFTCTVCNTFTAPNRKSLSAHERWCGKKK